MKKQKIRLSIELHSDVSEEGEKVSSYTKNISLDINPYMPPKGRMTSSNPPRYSFSTVESAIIGLLSDLVGDGIVINYETMIDKQRFDDE